MKTFLTFSSKAFRKNKKGYFKLVKLVEELGLEIADRWFEALEESSVEVYERSLRELKKTDLLIADVTYPSVGVGQQIEAAKRWSKKIIILFKNNGHTAPNLVTSLRGRNISFVRYNRYSTLKSELEILLPKIKASDLEKLNFISTKLQKKLLLEESKKLHISQSELLRSIIDEWVRRKNEKS
jgi:hypothetical protein